MKRVTKRQQEQALRAVAAWLGPRMGHSGPAPTGPDAAHRGSGPMLIPDWDWPSVPTPTIILEGGPHDWAVYAPQDETVRKTFDRIGVWAEPYAGYALCLYLKD